MPVMSGFELIDHLLNNYPNVAIVIITGSSKLELEASFHTCDSIVCMEKPIDFEMLVEKIKFICADHLQNF